MEGMLDRVVVVECTNGEPSRLLPLDSAHPHTDVLHVFTVDWESLL